ncbi:E3 ubiquitin-protein ligase hrd1 [Modicella reniformis]|uniref:RING-type E3 ubiquitin transferase n=1 Tax=Modicella reniformis TaxID=1440133 RepID=A0A9P6LTM1_9FUNG|nr:E3 ubiquitin-protein ligase hrd1 [Modicella reniformis]
MARLAAYGAVSTILAGGVIANAFAQRSNFYAACIYLYRSNACMMILLNLGLFLTIIAGQLVQIIFFGNLRALEVEHLYERAWYAVTETCLAMTIFKDEFDTRFVVMFTVLLFLKVFHWLCMDRVDSMEQSPEIPLSFHVRMVSMISILVSLDILLVLHAVEMVTLRGPNMMIMFGFEYTLLATSLLASFGKYVLHTIDVRSEEPWENKSMLLFYLDLVADFVKLVTYLLFFMVILVCYGLPLHIIRDVYMTMRSFLQKCKDLIQYRKATRNMNERYPDASAAELAALSDPICIICREEMVGSPGHQNENQAAAADAAPRPAGSNTNVPKKLPCGHIFHFHCLKSWLERQQSCPTCRRLVLDPPTPTPTPTPAGAAEAAPGAGQAPAPAPGQQGGAMPGFGNFGNNNPQQAPGLNGGNRVMPYPIFAPQAHYPLAGWHPQAMGAPVPGVVPQAGTQAGTGAGAGTTAAAGTGANPGAGAPGAIPNAPLNHIPHFTIPNVMHPIPGFIPLFPVGAVGAGRQEGQANNITAAQPTASNTSSAALASGSGVNGSQDTSTVSSSSASPFERISGANMINQIPLTCLDSLSEEQLKYLEENTRRGLQERLRVLQAIEVQITQSVSVLNHVMGALPPEGTLFRSDTVDPASPIEPHTTASPGSSAMNRMFGSSIGPGMNTTSASLVGLHSLSRSGLERVASNGEGLLSGSSEPTQKLSNTTISTDSTGAIAPSADTSLYESAQNAIHTVSVHPKDTTASVQGSLNNSQSEADDSTSNGQQKGDKGKGKKNDTELEKEAYVDQECEEEYDDSGYSPQEMVRRRWTRTNGPPAE